MAGPSSVAPWSEMAGPLPEDSAFIRLWRGFATARVAIAAVILGLLVALSTLGPIGQVNRGVLWACTGYLAVALAVRVFLRAAPPGKTFDPQWLATIGIDLMAFATLQLLQIGGINFSPLFAVPVLMASVLGSALLAFGTAAVVTLLLLSDAWLAGLQAPHEQAGPFLQAGLTGSGYFALAFLANQLAVRLAGEEAAARRSRRAARIQTQVNELVIETLADGVLVVDLQGDVHTANPAARLLLGRGAGPGRPFPLTAQPAWKPLVTLAEKTFTTLQSQLREVALQDPGMPPRRVFVRTRLTATHDNQTDSLCVIFLEDLREMEARLRTEKLAAMGRMSAAVAHEIRNPLAAITQANALLDEDLTDTGQRQLSGMVAQNAQRLSQIVDDILDISRVQHQGVAHAPAVLDLDAAVTGACEDWILQTRSVMRVHMERQAGNTRVQFDAGHLRRVLVNLLDNALRYAGTAQDSIQVSTSLTAGQAALVVWSDGAPLEATVQRHLFEPFFSSESRSSGLGLYICRELCERHGAQISYRRNACTSGAARQGNEFSVRFRPQSR